jgi:uncharacterized protein
MLNEFHMIFYLVILQFRMIFPYWIMGVAAGSLISVFASSKINSLISGIQRKKLGLWSIVFTSLLGATSPLCMYGTVPLIASLGKKGVPQHLLASFMISSILINPNLFIFSFALGTHIALIRLLVSITAGIIAAIMVNIFFKDKLLFDFSDFEVKDKNYNKSSTFKDFLSSLNRGIMKTAPYFLAGILLTALLDRFIQEDLLLKAFGSNSKFGVILAASLGVPVYVCGGGIIPLLKASLSAGMSIGAAVAFMITGPATKLTNLSAVKAILGIRNFTFYLAYNIAIAIIAGFSVDTLYLLFH